MKPEATIYAVGIGPGDADYIVPRAKEVILACEVIVGYTAYVELISELIGHKKVISTGMMGERARCAEAFKEARAGRSVAVISSGDAGVYGMASLLYEMSEGYPGVRVEVVPGVTAASSAASILGAPVSDDFAVISLSDLMTPWKTIEKRLEAAAIGDFVICLYNPGSVKRGDYLRRACETISAHKPPETCCGYVRNALRGNDGVCTICTLRELADASADMFTTVIIGNSETRTINGKLVTPRGYKL